MVSYTIVVEATNGARTREDLTFADDDCAILYLLPQASENLIELWRGKKLVATVDARPFIACAA